MKITVAKLKSLIKEEVETMMSEIMDPREMPQQYLYDQYQEMHTDFFGGPDPNVTEMTAAEDLHTLIDQIQAEYAAQEAHRKWALGEGIDWDPGQGAAMNQLQTLIGDLANEARGLKMAAGAVCAEITKRYNKRNGDTHTWDPGQGAAMNQLQTLIGDVVSLAQSLGVSVVDLCDEITFAHGSSR